MIHKKTTFLTLFLLLPASFTSAQNFTRITVGAIVKDGGNSRGCSWGDFDGDGFLDLFVANDGDVNFLYRNNGDGSFSKITAGEIVEDSRRSSSGSWGDWDNDGDLDLFEVNNFNGGNFLYRNDGAAGLSRIIVGSAQASGCCWGDYDNDGLLDMFVSVRVETITSRSGINVLYHSEGSAGLARITVGEIVNEISHSRGCSWSDTDNDGDLDLFVANTRGDLGEIFNFLYRNNGDGTFSKITSGDIVNDGGLSAGGSWGDYDNDGDFDLFVANDGDNFLYRNNGNGTFSKITTGIVVQDGGSSLGSSWGDTDNDGDLDLFVANCCNENNFIYQNNGNGTFAKISAGAIVTDGGNSAGSIWGDTDNDGDLDLFVTNILDENNFLYQNQGNGNHWINIKLAGTASNASAIGAKVRILATISGTPVRQMREISGQTGHSSQNSLRAHFGLGDATEVDSIRIEWPSGIVNDYANVPADTFLTLRENIRPQVANEIPFVTLLREAPVFVRDLNADPVVFTDPEGDTLTYSATSSDTSIAKAQISSSTLTIALVNETASGQAKITLTADDGRADDGRGKTEETTIEVNRRPFVGNRVPDQTIFLRETPEQEFVADLNNVFRDPDGDEPTYSTSSSDSSVAIATLTGSVLAISARDSTGEARIRITADDGRGGTASAEFTVTSVLANTPPRLENPIPDQVLLARGEPFTRDLNSVFIDDEDNVLTFSASSSNLTSALASVSFDTLLIVIPLNIGTAKVPVRANDGFGGETSTEFNVEVLRSFRPVISHEPILSQNIGQSITLEADITDEEGALANASLNYRVAGDSSFESISMDLSRIDDTTFHVTGSIPSVAVTNRGIGYFISAQDTHEVESRLPASGVIPVRVRVDGEGVTKASAQPGGSEQTGYRIISIPLDLNSRQPAAVLEDDLGSYDAAKWRLFQWVALAGGGVAKVEFPSTSEMSPGTAFWLIVKDAGKIIDSGPGTTVSTSESFQIPLNSGWNLVGNPFNFPTVAEETLSDGNPLQIFSYENGVWSDQLDPGTTELQPFAGYAVFSNSSATMFIKPNPFDTEDNLSKASDVEAMWSIRIRAQCQDAVDENNVAAVVQDASREWDGLDHPEPPAVGEYVSVYFPHPEWQRLNKRFSTDVRPEPFGGEEWEFVVTTNIPDVIDLFFEEIESIPAQQDIWLVDKALNITSNLRQKSTYSVAVKEGTLRQLALVVGTQEYLDEKLAEFQVVPTDFALSQNFPNPFNPATTIRYSLPNPGRVTLKVYNLLGKEVTTLIDNELKQAGNYVSVWDGRDAAGNVVASGLYLLRMQAGNFVQTRKMVLVQ